MAQQALLPLLLASLLSWQCQGQDYCFSSDPRPYRGYGTKTPYRDVTPAAPTAKEEDTPSDSDCQPLQLYVMARHGSRYPSRTDIQRMDALLPKLQQQVRDGSAKLCEGDANMIRQWKPQMTVDDALELGQEGWDEFEWLARRHLDRYPGLLNQSYSSDKFVFISTPTNRTRDSARAYARQLFGQWESIRIEEAPRNSSLWNFFYNCPRFAQLLGGVLQRELEKFRAGQQMTSTVKQITAKFGLSTDLTLVELNSLYYGCIFEYGLIHNDTWCSAFDPEQLRVKEYEKDLQNYWEEMYGDEIIYQRAYPIVQHIIDNFQKAIESGKPVSVLLSAHTMQLNGIHSILGMFKDEQHLRADDYPNAHTKRARTTKICPMSGNLALVLYNCTGVPTVKAFSNEVEIDIPNCERPCTFEKARRIWEVKDGASKLRDRCNDLSGGKSIAQSFQLIFSQILLLISLWHFS